jgi:hypothetical protein
MSLDECDFDDSSKECEGIDYFFGMTMKEYREAIRDLEDEMNPERMVIASQSLSSLSKEAVDVVNLIFNLPEEFVSLVSGKATHQMVTMNMIRVYLVKQKGWSHPLIERVFRDLKAWVVDNMLREK